MECQGPPPMLSENILERLSLKAPLPAALRLAFEQMFEPRAIDAIFAEGDKTPNGSRGSSPRRNVQPHDMRGDGSGRKIRYAQQTE
jgi:hypothetical protein